MVLTIDVGIKFIPLRTPGGELIPGSGLFVQIKKIVISVPKTSDSNVQKITQDQQIGGEEIAVVDIEEENYCGDEDTTLTDGFESETAHYCERITKREEQLRPTGHRCSHFKESVQLNVIAEVNDDAEELNTTNNSYTAA